MAGDSQLRGAIPPAIKIDHDLIDERELLRYYAGLAMQGLISDHLGPKSAIHVPVNDRAKLLADRALVTAKALRDAVLAHEKENERG
jgi:hypothetical protein